MFACSKRAGVHTHTPKKGPWLCIYRKERGGGRGVGDANIPQWSRGKNARASKLLVKIAAKKVLAFFPSSLILIKVRKNGDFLKEKRKMYIFV